MSKSEKLPQIKFRQVRSLGRSAEHYQRPAEQRGTNEDADGDFRDGDRQIVLGYAAVYVQVGVMLTSEQLRKEALEARASIGPWKASLKRMNVRFRKPVYIPVNAEEGEA